jgi:hypothetical protein
MARKMPSSSIPGMRSWSGWPTRERPEKRRAARGAVP